MSLLCQEVIEAVNEIRKIAAENQELSKDNLEVLFLASLIEEEQNERS